MTNSKIIVFPGPAVVETAAASHETAEQQLQRDTFGRRIVTAVEAAVTAVIGLCVITCTVAFLAML